MNENCGPALGAIVAGACICLGAACSSTGWSVAEQTTEFPSAEEVRQLAAEPTPDVEFEEILQTAFVEQWSLVGDLPTTLGDSSHRAENLWENELAARAQEVENVYSSEAMHCVAKQTAHFYREYDIMPSSSVSRFIGARCGWVGSATNTHVQWWEGEIATEQGWEEVKDNMLATVFDGSSDTPVNVGVWGGEVDGMTLFVLASGRQAVSVKSRPHRDRDSFVVEGRVLSEEFDAINALVTSGEYDVDFCERDEAIRFPEFRITCPIDEGDRMAWFEFVLDIKGQNWNRSGVAGLVWTEEADNTYRAAPWRRAWAEDSARRQLALEAQSEQDESQESGQDQMDVEAEIDAHLAPQQLLGDHVFEGESLEERILELTNIARELAGRGPVRFAEKQSQTNRELAPHFFRAQRERDWSRLDQTASSILAGWDVTGPILSATLQSSYSRTGDGRELVDSLLEMPSGRQILMTEGISRLALANLNEEGMTWTLISGYRDVPDLSGEELISTAIDTINDARAASGVSPLTDGDRYQAAAVLLADSVIRGERTPSEAAERIMTAMSRNNQSRVQAWVMLTDDLERLGLPDEIVITPNLPAAVMVAPWQGADEPWSMYRVIIITPQIRRGSPTQLVWDALRPGQKIGLMNRPASRVVPMGASWSLN